MTPEGWRLLTLGDVVARDGLQTGPFGSQLHSSDYVDDGVPVVMPRDILERGFDNATIARVSAVTAASLDRHRLRAGDLLFSRRGDLGRIGLVTDAEDGWLCGTGCLRARPGTSVLPEFLLHALRSADSVRWLNSNAVGQTMLNLNTEILSGIPLLVPPTGEQRGIAAVLSTVDKKAELTDALAAQGRSVKVAVMRELLTKGLPLTRRRLITLAEEWRIGRVAEDVREVPDDWTLVRLTEVARLESGHTPSRRHPEYWDGGVPWVSLHDSKRLDVPEIAETSQTISSQGLANSSARLLPEGTVVFSRTATVGKCTIMATEMSTSQDFANYVCGPRLHNRYLMQVFRHMQREWERLMAGSTHQTIYMPVFEQLQILLPPLWEQERIAQIAEEMDARIAREAAEADATRLLKEALASALLNGDVRLSVRA